MPTCTNCMQQEHYKYGMRENAKRSIDLEDACLDWSAGEKTKKT